MITLILALMMQPATIQIIDDTTELTTVGSCGYTTGFDDSTGYVFNNEIVYADTLIIDPDCGGAGIVLDADGNLLNRPQLIFFVEESGSSHWPPLEQPTTAWIETEDARMIIVGLTSFLAGILAGRILEAVSK